MLVANVQEFNLSVNFAGYICQRDWGVFGGENGGGKRLRADIGIEPYPICGTGPTFLFFQIPIFLSGILRLQTHVGQCLKFLLSRQWEPPTNGGTNSNDNSPC
jgi:hypothetical protein